MNESERNQKRAGLNDNFSCLLISWGVDFPFACRGVEVPSGKNTRMDGTVRPRTILESESTLAGTLSVIFLVVLSLNDEIVAGRSNVNMSTDLDTDWIRFRFHILFWKLALEKVCFGRKLARCSTPSFSGIVEFTSDLRLKTMEPHPSKVHPPLDTSPLSHDVWNFKNPEVVQRVYHLGCKFATFTACFLPPPQYLKGF